MKRRLLLFLAIFTCLNAFFLNSNAQLCTGSLGDPVVKITFGAGTNPGAPLGGSITNMIYVNNDCPGDGFYTIRNNTSGCFGNSWHTLNSDHTGDANGYMMVINASFQPSDFFVKPVDGLCGNTTYEFASWILSLDKLANSIPVNITFSIEKPDGTVLQSYDTKDIPPTSTPQWKQYGFFFKTPSDVTSVVIRMRNNAPGGNGNDLALDDITFRPCGPQLKSIIIDNGSDSIAFCEGSNKVITLNTTASSGYTSPVYQWQLSTDNGVTWSDIAGATTTTYLRNPTPKGKYLYRLAVAESGNGSIASCRVVSNNIIISVAGNPVIDLTTNSPVCEGSNLSLNASIINNGPVPGVYTFTYPEANPTFVSKTQQDDGVTNTSKIVQVILSNLNSAGTYALVAKNTYGCSSQATVNVVINKKPVANFTYDKIACAKSAINFTDQSTGISAINSWNWNFGDNQTSNLKNPTHVYDTSNNYTIKLVVVDGNGCASDTLNKNIIVNALPFTDFILPKVCLADPFAQFTDASTISDHTESGFTYLWNFGDPASVSNSSTIKNPQHVYKATGAYNVQLKVTSNNGCVKDTIKNFTVNGSVPKAMFTVDNLSPICSSDSVSLTNTSSVNFGSIVKVEVYWDKNNPALKTTDDSPYAGKHYRFYYSPFVTNQTQNFTIRYVVYSGINCVSETSADITINKTPVIQFDPIATVCEEIPAYSLTAGKEISGATGAGYYSGAGISGTDTFNPKIAGPGTHIIKYTFTTKAGCSAFKEQTLVVYPQPSVSAGTGKTIIIGATIKLHPTASGKGLSYLWTPPTFLDNAKDSSPASTPTNDITYKLTVTSTDGCMNSDTVSIKVLNGLYIPNAFTPNRDGRNDLWKLPYLDEFPNTVVNVYNRYGQIVYHSVGASVSWDGTFKGQPQPADIYVYIVDLKNGKPVIKGTIMLVR